MGHQFEIGSRADGTLRVVPFKERRFEGANTFSVGS